MEKISIIKKCLEAAYSGLKTVIDYALPPRCPNCGAVILADHSFCVECWQSLHFLVEPACIQCGFPLPRDQQYEPLCGRCLQHPPSFDRMNAAVAYDEISRQLILRCKYGKQTMLARDMAKLMLRSLPIKSNIKATQNNLLADKNCPPNMSSSSPQTPLIIPVPLHRWRLWQRGFNQAALIGQYLAKASGYDYDCDSLYRRHSTKPLGHLTPKQRHQMVKNAFGLRIGKKDRPLAGRDIILIDDVFTSGATTESCARLLKTAGVKSVHVLCWARVIPKDDFL
ncbi:ComF family protein [Zymomonas mobilis]|uniref:ComF family protein n=1 Tax=Zymomonas mobilis TaxID=542 RepID=UPI0003C76B94|nr:ComF family protein [Zymomonas mobilis]AHB09501.1 putative amidophosphoribosyltransferase [Zymomonas mobilis subsp. mobilis str. CP4 = NRRL B-14023]AHJ69807.1 DNA utilization protein GntX [Zymomonas mobilis subsp. mobilis NRRL B-12526]AHJ71662.1 DNA utilization protein GntX [Zymomonas mobilis subsp. mobilis str. CP4 = NRRL B-14023]TWE25080.1 ComF family protein [Zymomonas mobilis]